MKKKKKEPIVIILDIVIILLIPVLLLVGSNLKFYMDFEKESMSFGQDSSSFSFDLQNSNYASLIQGKYINEFNGETGGDSYQALADYVEASTKYKVYNGKGYMDNAKEQLRIMDEARKEMGELSVFADKVDGMLK